jgi:hypothetical protein
MRHILLIVILSVLLASCTSTRTLSFDPQTREDISAASTSRKARVVFNDEHLVDAFNIDTHHDSTAWYSKNIKMRYAAPTSSISMISVSTPRILYYGSIGAASGSLCGLGFGAWLEIVSMFSSPMNGTASFKPNIPAYVISGAIIGGLIGIVIGNNQRTDYIR